MEIRVKKNLIIINSLEFLEINKFFYRAPHPIDLRIAQYPMLIDCGQSNESNELDSHSHVEIVLDRRASLLGKLRAVRPSVRSHGEDMAELSIRHRREKRCRPRSGSLHLDWYRQPARGRAAVGIEDYSSSLASSSYALSRACWTSVGTCWYSAYVMLKVPRPLVRELRAVQ